MPLTDEQEEKYQIYIKAVKRFIQFMEDDDMNVGVVMGLSRKKWRDENEGLAKKK